MRSSFSSFVQWFITTIFVVNYFYFMPPRVSNKDSLTTLMAYEQTTNTRTEGGRKPLAVIHVGPHKTSTTSLQQSIVDYYKKGILPSDNFTIPLPPNMKGSMWKKASWIAHCFHPKPDSGWYGCDSNNRNKTMEYFSSFLSNASKTNSNILISAEDFTRVGVNMTLLQEYFIDFEVKVVVFYRRFYDWILSFYNQEAKADSRYPIFVEWIETNVDKKIQMYTAAVYDRYKAHFDVSILNMHDSASNPILPTFFCQYIGSAQNSCDKATKNPNMRKSNPSISQDHRHFWNAIGKECEYWNYFLSTVSCPLSDNILLHISPFQTLH